VENDLFPKVNFYVIFIRVREGLFEEGFTISGY